MSDDATACAGAILTVDLGAVARNYRRVLDRLGGVPSAAVVKADGYGLGQEPIARRLYRAGARVFFTALPDEARVLRERLPEAATIYVLNGLAPGTEPWFAARKIRPVLNSLEEISRWQRQATLLQRRLPAALHLDSGMSRLGLPDDEIEQLVTDPDRLAGIGLALVISHLACADEPDSPYNREQLARFAAARKRLPPAPASFANSFGIFLGPEYHCDLARPGAALYGINPMPGRRNPMEQVVRLQARILQVRRIDAPRGVGYGAAWRAAGATRVATVGLGYADGYLRSLSNRGRAWVGDIAVPVIGRVSMDLVTLDVSAIPEASTAPGSLVDFLGPRQGVDEVAEQAGTIGYEILTSLGRRFHRIHLDA